MPPKALVTGATGFIGSHLVEHLSTHHWKITCLIRKRSRTECLRKFPVRLIRGNTDDTQILEKAVEGQDYVFHLAGRIRTASPKIYDKDNRQLTHDLAQACLKKNHHLKRFLYVSSISAAGPSPPGRCANESLPPSPTSEYGRSKLRGEQAVQKVAHLIPVTIIRPPNVYGPRQQETEALIKLIKWRLVPLLKDRPSSRVSLIYVKDLTRGMVEAVLSPKTENQTYYLTDGKAHSWREVILTIKRAALHESLFIPLPEELIISLAWLMDIAKKTRLLKIYFGLRLWKAMTQTPWHFSSTKAKEDFGFCPEYSLEKGIRETVDYYSR